MSLEVPYNPDADEYLAGLSRGVVLMQTCATCSQTQFPPRVRCVSCGSASVSFSEVDGQGTVYAKTTNRRAPEPAFDHLVPYSVALVDLDIGVRVMARADCAPPEVRTGGRVRVFADPKPILLPGLLFVPTPATEDGSA
jgi:uncharacterized OB-fold protein